MRRQFNSVRIGGVLIALMAASASSGCEQQNTYVAPPPPKVTVAAPVRQIVTRYLEATGHAAAVNSVNLVARVQGFVTAINYKDGDRVKKGDVLFVIEPEPYRLKLQQSQAAERAAEATLKQAEAEYQRQTDLANRQVASKATLDNALASRDAAQAKLMQAKVDTRQAEINVGYTEVKAPFDGIATARQVSLGEMVGIGTPTVLASVVQLEPIYVNFDIGEQDVLRIRAEMARRGLTPQDLKRVPVEVGLQTESGYPHHGSLVYASPGVSQSTGTLAARALLQNSDRVLLPGYYTRVRIPLTSSEALLVPDVALGTDQGGRYLLTVNKENVVEQQKVEVGQQVGNLRVIKSGLKPDERIIVAGLLRAVPGQKVDPQSEATIARAK